MKSSYFPPIAEESSFFLLLGLVSSCYRYQVAIGSSVRKPACYYRLLSIYTRLSTTGASSLRVSIIAVLCFIRWETQVRGMNGGPLLYPYNKHVVT
jgi:hypothetical protein